MPVHETDICIIGGGITSAMLAERLCELKPGVNLIVVEAGRSIFDTQNRGQYRERARPGAELEEQHRGHRQHGDSQHQEERAEALLLLLVEAADFPGVADRQLPSAQRLAHVPDGGAEIACRVADRRFGRG